MTWETVIGLEIHVQLNTQSKIFSGASTAFGAEPNAHASVVECALPGVLPVMNREVVEKAIKLGLALDAKINQKNVFDRKNYFYPDLPKGYQISQLDLPIVEHGKLEIVIGDAVKTINVTRAHMEEDAGKSVHEGLNGATGIDLNRAGTPLLEVVSEPEMRSAAEAVAYAKALHSLVTWLDICDGNMAMPTYPCVRRAKRNSARAARLKTSILSASWSRRLITKWKRKSRFWKTAAKYSRQPCCLTRKKAKPA